MYGTIRDCRCSIHRPPRFGVMTHGFGLCIHEFHVTHSVTNVAVNDCMVGQSHL